jgi:hypothetical protein
VVFAQNTPTVTKRLPLHDHQPARRRYAHRSISSQPRAADELSMRRFPIDRPRREPFTPRRRIRTAVINGQRRRTGVGGNGQWQVKTDGAERPIVLNPDIDNPDIDNPTSTIRTSTTPTSTTPRSTTPISTIRISIIPISTIPTSTTPISTIRISITVRVANPDIDNPDIDNPDIDNPDIDNPDIDNPDIDNSAVDGDSLMTDVTWAITNTGNTTASYNVNLFFAQQTFDPRIQTQLILYRTYKTPVVRGCDLKTETHNVLVANIPDPHLVTPNDGVSEPNDPRSRTQRFTRTRRVGEDHAAHFDPHRPAKVVTVTNPDGTTAKIVERVRAERRRHAGRAAAERQHGGRRRGVTEPPIVCSSRRRKPFPIRRRRVRHAGHFNVPRQRQHRVRLDEGDLVPPGWHGRALWWPRRATSPISHQPVISTRSAARSNSGFERPGRPTSNSPGRVRQTSISKPIRYRNQLRRGRTTAQTCILVALDARPSSPTFHQYLPMLPQTDVVLAFAIDSVHGRLYAASGPNTSLRPRRRRSA